MEIDVNDQQNLVSVWVTNSERERPSVLAQLQDLYKESKEKKYTVAVFHSGQNNLQELTSDLLCHNRTQSAAREVQNKSRGVER